MGRITYDDIIIENYKRLKKYFQQYDPVFGDENQTVVPRFKFQSGSLSCLLPIEMLNDYPMLTNMPLIDISDKERFVFNADLMKLRCRYDFEFWCYTCVKIEDKLSKQMIPLRLNYGQRKTAHAFEQQRLAGEPIRVIICKARQWGGSTVTQMYMLWLQLFHFRHWHSAIISQLKSQSANIRDMITKVVNYYPKESMVLDIGSYEGSPYIKYIPQRKCKIQIASAENPDALRSFDFSMLHMSEVGLWKSTATKSADDIAQAVYATVPKVYGSFICMESTAKGVGNFFHHRYEEAKSGESAFLPVFVSWFEIENYAAFKYDATGQLILRDKKGIPVTDIEDYESVISNFSDYQRLQWHQGATIEGIVWYKQFQKGASYNDFQMKSEFPGTDSEAFQTKSNRFFEEKIINYADYTRKEPEILCDIRGDSLYGEDALKNIYLDMDGYGTQSGMAIWIKPEPRIEGKPYITNQFVVIVDVGGSYTTSDWSVISVFDRSATIDPNGALERAATWRGHVAPDVLAWKAVQVAKYYNNALLVIESNTLDARYKKAEATYEGNHFYTVLNEISHYYSNLYMRQTTPDKAVDGITYKYGWHTNVRTKQLAYDKARAIMRQCAYVERDSRAVDEMKFLEQKPDGSLGAIIGEHDDIIDTVAIGIYISFCSMDEPREVNPRKEKHMQKIVKGGSGFASF